MENVIKLQLEESNGGIEKKKIAFLVKEGLDSFLGDIIEGLSKEYEVRKIIVTTYNHIVEGMKWADICWFEWCDELLEYGSKHPLAGEKKIICRIHGYEVYSELIKLPQWDKVDNLILVAPHRRRLFLENTRGIKLGGLRTHIIYCGVNSDKYPLNKKKKGYNIGYLGFIKQ